MSRHKAAEARKGLFDSLAGKAKEVAGAVSGNDHLVEEGQLQQAEAGHRKAAAAADAVADAKQDEAAQTMLASSREAAQRKEAAAAEAEREDSLSERQRDSEHAVAALGAEVQEAADRAAAERRADELAESGLQDADAMAADAIATEEHAAAEKRRLERDADAADQSGRAVARRDRELRSTMISTLIALPYELARLPVVIVDKNLSDRLPESSGPRVGLDRAIGAADKLAGTLLGNRAIARRGADRIERSVKLVTAARLEHEGEARREQAQQAAVAGRRQSAAKRRAAQRRAATGLAAAATAEARGKQEAKAKAAATAAANKAAADQRAADRAGKVEERRERAVSAAEAKKQGTQRGVEDDLADARTTKRTAAARRSDADRLGDLTTAKKQVRKQR